MGKKSKESETQDKNSAHQHFMTQIHANWFRKTAKQLFVDEIRAKQFQQLENYKAKRRDKQVEKSQCIKFWPRYPF